MTIILGEHVAVKKDTMKRIPLYREINSVFPATQARALIGLLGTGQLGKMCLVLPQPLVNFMVP